MERITRFRALVLLLIFSLLLGLFSVRMYGVQMLGQGDVVQSSTTYTSVYRVKAARGDLMDRDGRVLVGNRATYNLSFNNFVLLSSDDPNAALLRLVQLCDRQGIEYEEHFPVSMTRPYEYDTEASSTWKGYFQSYLSSLDIDSDISASRLIRELRRRYRIPDEWTDEDARRVIGLRFELALRTEVTNLPSYVFIEDVDDDDLTAIMELNVPGLDAEVSTVREYHTTLGAHILGTMGKISAEDWPEYKDKGYAMDAYVGVSGLEQAFEEYLRGTDGTLVRTVDKDGNVISEYYEVLPQAGCNVELSVDWDLQAVAEASLARVIEELRNGALAGAQADDGDGTGMDAEGGSVVVLDVNTGEILACASYPTYNLLTYRDEWDEILAADFDPLINRALESAYAPGSVYKMVTTVAGIEANVINRYTEILTKGYFDKYKGLDAACLIYSNRKLTHGLIDVSEALQVSCNYFFYEVGDKLHIDTLDGVAKSFGLGEATGVELWENEGRRSNPETKERLYEGVGGQWYAGDKVLTAIGQSENRFTPLQLASYTATLANRGTRYATTFLSRVVSSDYSDLVEENLPTVLSYVQMDQETIEAYRSGMRKVVTYGTASEYFLEYKTAAVAGKTGTAEHGSGGSSHGSFVCFAPYENPEIAIAVYVEKAGQGGYLANVAKDIMDEYFSRDKASELITYENRIS